MGRLLLNPEDVNLYLVGFMGTGKTTVGRSVAHRLGFKCVDSDHEIERGAGKPISRIFAEEGEAHFRALERRFIEEGHAAQRLVVACGGGLVVQPGMLELLSSRGVVVCLHASIETDPGPDGAPRRDPAAPRRRGSGRQGARPLRRAGADLPVRGNRDPHGFAALERDRRPRRAGVEARVRGICPKAHAGRGLRRWAPARRTFGAGSTELGFDEVRFARLSPGPGGGGLRRWLDAGHHADMAWMERTAGKRMDPGLVLEGARSAVLLGVNYFRDGAAAGPGDGATRPMWARYCAYRGLPRHPKARAGAGGAVRSRSSAGPRPPTTATTWTRAPSSSARGPARSGSGFIGKNSMLISRTHGNWLFLACILTRVDLEPDPPLRGGAASRERWGCCAASARAAWTHARRQAFPEPGVVDARRCISYQTIENRGIIPAGLRVGHRRPRLRLRHLPGRLPVEPVREGGPRA